jgi:GAF domain-containing protein
MTLRGNLLGVVVVAHRPSEHYSKEERALLEHVVHEIGIALFAARARGQAQFLTESTNDNTLPESWRLRARKLILGIREA